MRKLFLFLFLCFFLIPGLAWPGTVVVKKKAVATTWIYHNSVTSATGGVEPGADLDTSASIAGENRTLTYLSFNLYAVGSATACKVALYLDTDGNRTYDSATPVASGTKSSGLSTGWNDVAVSATIYASKTYWVVTFCNAANYQVGSNASATAGGYSFSCTYSSFPCVGETGNAATGNKYVGRVGY